MRRLTIISSLSLIFISTAISSAQAAEFEGSAQPADVLVAVSDFAADLEAVRRFMGKRPVMPSRFRVEFATPRHVYFQAQSLFRKTNRLGTEVAGFTRQTPPPAPEGTILPEDVLRVIQLVRGSLDLLGESVGVTTGTPSVKRDARTAPKDVFAAIVQANRQVNLMMDQPFRPADVHGQLSLVNVYLAGVLSNAGVEPFPKVEFVPNKQPVDVYDKLIDCLSLNQQVGKRMNLPVLKIDARRLRRVETVLADNFEVATILVSDVAFWSDRLNPDEDLFPPSETLRHIFPAHVFAKASVVEMQLKTIIELLDDATIAIAGNAAPG